MTHAFALLLATVLANNLVFARLLGVETLAGASRLPRPEVLALGAFTAVAVTLAATLGWVADRVLLRSLALEFLRTPLLILVAFAAAALAGTTIARGAPALRDAWQRLHWQVVANSAVLGATLLATRDADDFATALLSGAGAGAGFALVLVLFAALRERVVENEVPAPFRGAPIELLIASLMALAFLGLAGLERHV